MKTGTRAESGKGNSTGARRSGCPRGISTLEFDAKQRILRGLLITKPKSISVSLQIPEGDFDAFIFDCDGTLADTMPTHYRAWQTALGEHVRDFPEAMFYELGGVPTSRIVEILNERHGHTLPVEETVAIKERYFLEFSSEIAAIEPVVSLAREWHGRKPIAVASGGHRRIVLNTLRALGIVELFDTIVTSEDYSRGKPHPDPFLEAARRLGVAPERCLVFEDTTTGIQAATAAGMASVLVPQPDRSHLKG